MKKILKMLILFTLSIAVQQNLQAQSYIIVNIAGTGTNGYNGDGIPASAAELNTPVGIAVDDSGNVYISDVGNSRVRKIDHNTGLIYTIAGTGTPGYNGDGIPATAAELNSPLNIAVDDSGNVYIADRDNNRIRKIDHNTGLIYTIAGTGTLGYNGDGIPATAAELNYPTGIAIDDSGNVYIADYYNNRIRKIDHNTGLIYTVAGTGTSGYNGDGIPATAAELNGPIVIAIDDSGNVYISDLYNQRIREVHRATGIITTIAGTGTTGYNGDSIPATTAELFGVASIDLDDSGNVYIGELGYYLLRKIDHTTGMIYTIAETGYFPYNGDSIPALSANRVCGGIACYNSGNIYVTTTGSPSGSPYVSKLIPTSIITLSDSIVCTDDTVHFTPSPLLRSSLSYHWLFPGGNPSSSTLKYPSVVYPAVGNYIATMIISDTAYNYIDTVKKVVRVKASPIVAFNISDTIGCSPLCVHFNSTGNDTDIVSFLWNFGDGNTGSGSSTTHCYHSTGSTVFSPNLTVTSSNGCKASLTSNPITVINTTADFYTPDIMPLSPGEKTEFISQSIHYDSLLWHYKETGETQSGNDSVTFKISKDNPYATICLTAYNTYCEDTTCKKFKVNIQLLLPNVITPNRDGINDNLKIKGISAEGTAISIYNRWGRLIYHSDNYQNDWAGTAKSGKKLSDGTYYYVLTTKEGKTYKVAFTILD